MLRKTCALLVVLAAACVASQVASATTDNYWGYNNMTSSNPPSGTCPGHGSGRACSGWNYWDYSQIDRNSGSATIGMGFIYNDGSNVIQYIPIPFDPGTYTVVWNDSRFSSPTHYNKAACLWLSGTYAYLQCRALIFFDREGLSVQAAKLAASSLIVGAAITATRSSDVR